MLTTDILITAIALAGSETKLGTDLGGYTQNAVWAAKRSGRTSGPMARKLDEWTGGRVSRSVLRPDVFGDPSEAEVASTMNWLVENWPDTPKTPRPAYLSQVAA